VGRSGIITVNEPATARRKDEVLTALRSHAPDEQRRLLEEGAKGW
jgi:hypothetical protein